MKITSITFLIAVTSRTLAIPQKQTLQNDKREEFDKKIKELLTENELDQS